MMIYAENLPTAEVPEYPSTEQITDTCNAAFRLYNIAGGVFGPWTTTKDDEGAHFTTKRKGLRFIPNELHIDLAKDGMRGVDISVTARDMIETGHECYTVITSLRPELDPEDQPEVITERSEYGKDLVGEYASGGIFQAESVPLTVNLLNSLSEYLLVVLQSVENLEVVAEPVRQSRFARIMGKLITAS